MSTLTAEQTRIFKALHNKQSTGAELTENEELWMQEAKLHVSMGRKFDKASPDESEPDSKPPVVKAEEIDKILEVVDKDVEDSEKEIDEEVNTYEAYLEALMQLATEQGVEEEITEARAKYKEVYINAVDGKVFAYRPARFKDLAKLKTGVPAIENHKVMCDLCIVAGYNNVITEDPKLYVYSTIAEFIESVSAVKTDSPYVIRL